ncbi:choice-of-anchor I family protein [Planctomicrobium sp. SH661]|uniref:choice-of-anchor I family protein n=1 Tax=Planctomicrobium sp. SH661 TaxID=3448124 RepID=UPI003F5C341F
MPAIFQKALLVSVLASIALAHGCGQVGFGHSVSKVAANSSHVDGEAPLDADPELPAPPQPRGQLQLFPLGGHEHGGASGAEISAYDVHSMRLFTVNGAADSLDIQNIADPTAPQLITSVSLKDLGRPTSVSARQGMIAVSVLPDEHARKGSVLFLTEDGDVIKKLEVGYGPDMLTFSPDARWLLVANEGEPDSDYAFDPPGSISLIDVRKGPAMTEQADVVSIGFEKFNKLREALAPSIRIYSHSESVAQDLEPEYIAVSADSRTAWVTCQENNAIAVIDMESREVTQLKGLGFKDHSIAGQGLDASDEDGKIRIRPWPVRGMYEPDGIASFQIDGRTYLATANEGELREYRALNEQKRVKDLALNVQNFPQGKELKEEPNLGRLRVSNAFGDHDNDGVFEELFSAGTRSFSIWSADVEQVFDSGNQFERYLAHAHPQHFNSEHEALNFDDRSDNKGCEPESVTTGVIDGGTYAFIVLERMGGVMVYDVTSPHSPVFESYTNTRGFDGTVGDTGPEGVLFITAEQSPIGKPLLVVSYEISGTTRIFECRQNQNAPRPTAQL